MIGHGASGSVYRGKAFKECSYSEVAIKTIPLQGCDSDAVYFAEMISLKHFPHHNIVKYLNSFMEKDLLWIVMEYVDGVMLTEWIYTECIVFSHVAYISRELLLALESFTQEWHYAS